MEAGISWLLRSNAPFEALFLFPGPVNSNTIRNIKAESEKKRLLSASNYGIIDYVACS